MAGLSPTCSSARARASASRTRLSSWRACKPAASHTESSDSFTRAHVYTLTRARRKSNERAMDWTCFGKPTASGARCVFRPSFKLPHMDQGRGDVGTLSLNRDPTPYTLHQGWHYIIRIRSMICHV
eukprot:1184756-Prorocentrum_minimum.AAC.3